MTDAEMQARLEAAWRAGRDAAAAWHDVQAAQAQGFADAHVSQLDHDAWQGCADQHRDSASDIRALQPPADLAAAAATCDAVAVELLQVGDRLECNKCREVEMWCQCAPSPFVARGRASA